MYVEELCPQHKDQSCCWASVSPICGTKQRGSNYLSPNSTSQLWRSERPTSNSAWCSVSTYLFQTLEEIQGKKKFLLPVYDERQTGSTTDFLSFFFTVISCKAGIQYDLQKNNISCTNKWNRHWSIRKKKNSKMLKPNNSQHWLTKCSHNEHLNAPKETIRSNKSVPLTWLICRIINTSAPGVVPQDAPFLPPWCISLLETVINTDTCLMLLFNNRPATSPKTLT